ncbi:hypothetical protein ACLOJK_007977 [Asimina triloba]
MAVGAKVLARCGLISKPESDNNNRANRGLTSGLGRISNSKAGWGLGSKPGSGNSRNRGARNLRNGLGGCRNSRNSHYRSRGIRERN